MVEWVILTAIQNACPASLNICKNNELLIINLTAVRADGNANISSLLSRIRCLQPLTNDTTDIAHSNTQLSMDIDLKNINPKFTDLFRETFAFTEEEFALLLSCFTVKIIPKKKYFL